MNTPVETQEVAGLEPAPIRKLYFMYHPTCWAQAELGGRRPPAGEEREKWLACLEWERRVNERQKRFMSDMKPDEALVMFPIGGSEAMLKLQQHATRVLGRRCIIVEDVWTKNAPEAWSELVNPVERFLDNDKLEGRAEFMEGVPPEIRSELESEIREACRVHGYDWNITGLKVIYHSRMVAAKLQKEFRARRLHYDPATLVSEAFGEGFEQCAMTWKAMLVPYLGFARPAENIFDLSVSGAPFLATARFRERIKLSGDTRLFLWVGEDGRSIGLYARAWCRLADPQLYARVPLEGLSLEVWDVAKRRWPADDSSLKVENAHMKVPVYNAIRRDDTDGSFYLIAGGVSFDGFRRRLVNAETGE